MPSCVLPVHRAFDFSVCRVDTAARILRQNRGSEEQLFGDLARTRGDLQRANYRVDGARRGYSLALALFLGALDGWFRLRFARTARSLGVIKPLTRARTIDYCDDSPARAKIRAALQTSIITMPRRRAAWGEDKSCLNQRFRSSLPSSSKIRPTRHACSSIRATKAHPVQPIRRESILRSIYRNSWTFPRSPCATENRCRRPRHRSALSPFGWTPALRIACAWATQQPRHLR